MYVSPLPTVSFHTIHPVKDLKHLQQHFIDGVVKRLLRQNELQVLYDQEREPSKR